MVFRWNFFNKLSDLLSMNKNELHDSLPKINQQNTMLTNIYDFWRTKKGTYQYLSCSDAAEDDYLLYGSTLMLWAFGKCAPILDIDKYPVYFMRECRISNPKKLHTSLIENGYLGFPNIYEFLQTYRMPELKIMAESIGCEKSGRKSELIKRIIDNLPFQDIENLIKQSELFSLTEKGQLFLQNNFDLVELHIHYKYNISLSEFIRNRFIGNRRRSFNDNVYNIISNRIYNNTLNQAYNLLEADYCSLYEITLSEGRYDIAIKDYITSLYLRTCCIRTASYTFYAEHDFSYKIIFTSNTATKMVELADFYSPNIIDNIYKEILFPPSFLSKEEFISAIADMISETMFDFEKYNNIIRTRLTQYSYLKS